MKTFYVVLLLCLIATPKLAGDDKNVTTVRGFVDGYYAWNDNSPDNHENFVPGAGTTAKRANEFNLNLAAIDIVHDEGPVGFHFSAIAGNGADVVHAGEPRGTAIGPDVYRHIY